MYRGPREAVQAIYAYFRSRHRDAPSHVARAFRRKDCTVCVDGMVERNEAMLGYCECVKALLKKTAEGLVASGRDYGGPDDQVV